MQDGHPVAFASRSLTSTEQKYAQIEKEMLAIVFAIQKFHFYIYGLKVKVNTDHKPLESIFRKDLSCISPRLQRMRLRILNYDLEVTYKPGKYLYIADTLSRAFLSEKGLKSDEEFNFAVHAVVKNIPMSETKKIKFREALDNDAQLKLVASFCSSGWPENKHDIPDCVRQFFKIRESLCFVDGLLLYSEKIVVPHALRCDMLKLLHEGHVGMEKAKSRARQIFYWPGINIDIENFIRKCKVCETNARKQQKESLKLYPIPERPWERLGLDIFTYGGKSYLVAFDSYSNWLEIRSIKDKSIKSVISSLKNIFSVFGSPDIISCDNVPFDSFEFKEFAKDWNFTISTRSPHYPRSNGLAEKGVGIGKNIVKKSLESGSDVEIALLQYRNSPLKFVGYSPSQLLMGRICKTKIPISADLLKPKLCENVQQKLKDKHEMYQKQYNKTARDLKPLKKQNVVTMYNHVQKKWEPGCVLKADISPRSYFVTNQYGNCVKRNRVDLRPSVNNFIPTDDPTLSDNRETLEKESVSVSNDQSEGLLRTQSSEVEKNNFVEHQEHSRNLERYKTSRSGRCIKPPLRLDL